ncbi:hypothetical protein [Nocardia sp. NBC_01388]|uniref:hypothetical protein n=1 Tax=Nocardia sp. NBC_01388 TaxID=2903596 RepID=UPI00324C1EE6
MGDEAGETGVDCVGGGVGALAGCPSFGGKAYVGIGHGGGEGDIEVVGGAAGSACSAAIGDRPGSTRQW